MGRQTWIDSNVFSTAQDAEELISVTLIPVKQLYWSKRYAIQLQICFMVDYYPKYYAMLSNNKRYWRATHSENEDFCRARHEPASRGAKELFASLVVVTVDSPLFSRARHELTSRSAKELCASLVVVTVDSPLFTKIEYEFDRSNRYAIVLQTR